MQPSNSSSGNLLGLKINALVDITINKRMDV
jgi:hypothetical protein